MGISTNPLFWAFVGMFGLVCCCGVVGTERLGKHTAFGFFAVAIFDLGRFLMVLPFCPQPRFDLGGMHPVVGGILFAVGLAFGLIPANFQIRPLNSADAHLSLNTNGFYRIVRNPIYLGELLYSLGWAVIFRSTIGVALIPVWWIGLLVMIAIEEERLERTVGPAYLDYKNRVRGRIIPGSPV